MSFAADIYHKVLRRFGAETSPTSMPTPTEPPWFDHPDALASLDARRSKYRPGEYEALRKWVADGYFVVEGMIPHRDIDAMNADVDRLWSRMDAIKGFSIHDLPDPDLDGASLTHERLVSMDPQRREGLRRGNAPWRLMTFSRVSEPMRAVRQHESVNRWLSLIYDRPSTATNDLYFEYGSTQSLHQDMAVFPIEPKNYLVGVWIAAEDIHPDSGPLVYYPGTHREPMWEGFPGYPEQFLRTCTRDLQDGYHRYVAELAQAKYQKHQFLAKKGDVLFWHGMLVHGGEQDRNKQITRKSLVLHSIPVGCDITSRLKGPFNW